MMKIREELLAMKKNSYANGDFDIPEGSMDCTEGVNPYGCPEEVLAVFRQIRLEEIINYPHDVKVYEAVCDYWSDLASLEKDNIMLTDGSIAAIYIVNNLFAQKGAKVLGVAPQFSDYVSNARLLGMNYRYVALDRADRYKFDVNALLAQITDDLAAVYLDNPNNPTGQMITAGEIEMVLRRAKAKGVCVILDEAYGDFVSKRESAMQLMDEYENLIVLRTLSKGFGMAGIRAGYIAASKELIGFMSQITNPYAVGQMSRRMMAAALDNAYRLERDTQEFASAKVKVRRVIGENIKMAATDDTAPIFLLYHKDPTVDLYRLLVENGIVAVPGSAFDAIDNNCVRVRLSSEEDFPQYLKLLARAEVAAGQAGKTKSI